MAIRTFLQSLGATHLFTLDNEGTAVSDDLGDSVDPTRIKDGSYLFVTNPVCEGVTHSLQATNSSDVTTRTDGARLDNRNDIHGGNGAGNDSSVFNYVNNNRTVHLWFKQPVIDTPTCIYEQGGGTNNFAFIVGTAKAITWQAADSGQPFLIAQSKFLAEVNRAYFVLGVWEHHSNHAGSGNRILFYINGVLQEIIEGSGTDNFPTHSGDICIGNTAESLKSYNEDTVPFSTRTKYVNMLGMYNNVSLSEAQSREIFERTVIPEVTISADTVVNQQAALDALIGNSYAGINCAIRIVQATDATDYRLFVDNINFIADDNIQDISVQFVGTGTITLENTNGTVIKYTSTPSEVETTSTTYTGGGSIVVVNNTIRYFTPSTITNSTATKLVIETAGNYEISGGTISSVENVSGGSVTILISNGASTPTIIGSGITLTFPDQPISITNISAGSRLRIYNVTTGAETVNTVVSGTSYTSSYQEGTGYNDGDTVRVYLTKLGKDEWVGDVIDTSNGFNVLASQDDDDVYTALGIDGTTVTKFQADYVNNEVDLVIGADWTMAELYAWWANNLTTEDGIRNFFGGITAIDQANFRINTSIVDLYLDNTTNASYKQTDNRRFYRDTGTGYPVRNPTTSGYGLDVVWRNTILIAQTEAGGTSDLNFYDVKRAVKQVITNPKYIKGQK